jgi:glutathione S-transferase
MKLYIADATSSQAIQIVANELGLEPELVHFDVVDKTTSNGEDFSKVNPLLYVPVLELDTKDKHRLTEVTAIAAYLADAHPEAGLAPQAGTVERVKFDQLLAFIATEIQQRHVPLMRKLMTEEGMAWQHNKIANAYRLLDERLAHGAHINGDRFSVADAIVWGTFWHERSGTEIGHLKNLLAWKARMDARPSVRKTLQDEATIVASHKAKKAA